MAYANRNIGGLRAFNAFGEAGRTHQRGITAGKRPQRQRGSTFFVPSTAIKATHKAISPTHTNDYLGAFYWTTNRRTQMASMLPAFCRAIATSSTLTRLGVYRDNVVSIG